VKICRRIPLSHLDAAIAAPPTDQTCKKREQAPAARNSLRPRTGKTRNLVKLGESSPLQVRFRRQPFLWFYFINEHVMRFLGKRVPPGYDTVPLLLFWALLLVWLAPWCAFLPQAVAAVPARWRELRLGAVTLQ
jgi:hypothetical protein